MSPLPLRRGSALVAVLVIVVIGVLLAAGIMSRAVSRVEDSTLALKRSGSRAMAWSGVQAAMAKIASQREQLLMGGDVNLADSRDWEYADTDGPGVWTVSLLPLDAAGNISIAEAASVNVNTASESQLAKVASLGPTGAAGVMGRRARGPIVAVEQLEVAASHGSESLTGTAGSEGHLSPASDESAEQLSSNIARNSSEGPSEGNQRLTALSADATVMLADGKTLRYRASDLSNKDTPAEIKAEQDERLGGGASAARTWAKRPKAELNLANLVADLQGANMPAAEWGKVLDAIEPSEDLYVLGRIDINRADEATLATLPGVDLELASNLVRVRATLDESGRRDLAWPVVSGAIDAKVFAGFVDLITTRTMQYRVRVQAGRTVRQDATGVESDEFGVAKNADSPVTDRCVFEAVIDVAGDVPRIAYLRDITLLDSAAMVADALAEAQQYQDPMAGDVPKANMESERDVGMDDVGSEPGVVENEISAESPSEGAPDAELETEGLQRSGGLDLGGGLDRVGGLNRQQPTQPDAEPIANSDRETGSMSKAGPIQRGDPRLGRWNATSVRASQSPSTESADPRRSGANDVSRDAGSQDAAGTSAVKPEGKRVMQPAAKPGTKPRTKPERKAGTK